MYVNMQAEKKTATSKQIKQKNGGLIFKTS